MVMDEDMGDGNIQCTNHPYQNSSPGGICAFCLQEKLGKLVSSSFPSSIFPSSTPSSSSSPSFRSDFVVNTSSSSQNSYKSMSKPPLVSTNKINVKNLDMGFTSKTIPFNRSKSIATPSRGVMHLLDENYAEDYSPHRRKFWSFLHLTSKKNESKKYKDLHFPSATPSLKREEFVVVDENGINSPNEACFDSKVSRSRSVGCGSRSFSFGDCSTLRRVESQREGSIKMNIKNNQDFSIKERVKCGGIFSGFMITSSSSSSLDWESNGNGRRMSAVHSSFPGHVSSHGRSKSWGWALASPMRVFSKPSSVKKGDNSRKNGTTPDLNAIPSLLSV